MKRRRLVLLAVFLVGIALIYLISSLRTDQGWGDAINSNSSLKNLNKTTEISDTEGRIQIKPDETVTFISGVSLNLYPKFLRLRYNDAVYEFKTKISYYVNGTLITIDKVSCNSETKFFDDYWAPVVTDCEFDYKISKADIPDVTSYTNFKTEFNSVVTKENSRFRIINKTPWLALSVPYAQVSDNNAGNLVNVVSPREDEVAVYTNYGKVSFIYENADFALNQQKSATVGPLNIALTPIRLDCAGIYRQSNGNCHTSEGKDKTYTTYNQVVFKLEVSEQGTGGDYPLLLDIGL